MLLALPVINTSMIKTVVLPPDWACRLTEK